MVRRLPPCQERARPVRRRLHVARHRAGGGARTSRAVEISGQKHIPVVLYGDGSFQVEPSVVDIQNKLKELGLLG